MFFKDNLLPTESKGLRFVRRHDLTPDIRLTVAYKALNGVWGDITQLAREFMVSRTFIYLLMKDLKEITETVFGTYKTYVKESAKEKAITLILYLRLVERCSIPSISQLLKRFEIAKYHSVGSVSQILQFAGNSLPNTLVNTAGGVKVVIIASDEIFSHMRPILITVEPVSSTITKEVTTIGRLLPELFSYLNEAKRIVEELKELELPEEVIKTFCIAWQYQKNYIKAKKPERRNKYKAKEHEELELLKAELGEEFQELKETVYSQLDTIVQSSAMVENINSILRMYLNTSKNHITQGMLNLFMHYHNHRRYVADKRKGKTPFEILTNRKQEKDWLELLIEKVPWHQCDFLKIA